MYFLIIEHVDPNDTDVGFVNMGVVEVGDVDMEDMDIIIDMNLGL